MSEEFDCSKHLRMLFRLKNRSINRVNLGVTIQFASSSSINGLDEMLGCEWSRLSLIYPIEDGGLRYHHVACEEEAASNTCRLIFIERMRCHHASLRVHRENLISIIITPQMND